MEDELVPTPVDRVLAKFTGTSQRSTWTQTPFRYEDSVIATNGHALCIASPMLCNLVYQTLEDDPKALRSIFEAKPEKKAELLIKTDEIRRLVKESPDDFKPGQPSCKSCDGSGTCSDCSCEADHDCGKCGGVGYKESPAKKLIGIGTGTFSIQQLEPLASAAREFELSEWIYLGSDANDYLHFFDVGDCFIVLASTRQQEDQERVGLEAAA